MVISYLYIFMCLSMLSCGSNNIYRKVEKTNRIEQNLRTDSIPQAYEDWKSSRMNALLAPKGWMSIIDLSWLDEGENLMGSGAEASIKLGDEYPEKLANFILEDGKVYFENIGSNEIRMNGALASSQYLDTDQEGQGEFNYQHLYWNLIKRGQKLGIRIKDASLTSRIRVAPIPYFDYNNALVFKAKVIETKLVDSIAITNILGMTQQYRKAAQLQFKYQGKKYTLDALDNNDTSFFVMFSDATSSFSTYGGGRYLYIDKVADSAEVTIDFNKAINPPCVFTLFATCPLPPVSNHLGFEVHAGEKKWHD